MKSRKISQSLIQKVNTVFTPNVPNRKSDGLNSNVTYLDSNAIKARVPRMPNNVEFV